MRSYLRSCSWPVPALVFLSLGGCSEIPSGSRRVPALTLVSSEEVSEPTETKAGETESPVKVARSTKTEKPVPQDAEVLTDAGKPKAKEFSPILVPFQKAEKKPLDPNPTRPTVILSDAHQKTCRKLVGDMIAATEVTDIQGTRHKLSDLLSDKLTVLIFWNEKSILAAEQFRRIPVEVLGTFASYRVKVIAANVGGEVARTRILTGDAADKIVSLVDTDATLFHQFAESRIPRTYVLDKDGKILWFDIEYSQSTVRSLANALTFFLTNER